MVSTASKPLATDPKPLATDPKPLATDPKPEMVGQTVPANLVPSTPATVAASPAATETATRTRRTVTDAEKLVSYQVEQAKLVKSLPAIKQAAKDAQAKLRANVADPTGVPLTAEETQALIKTYGAYKAAHARLEVLNAEIPKLISAVIDEEID
jgi:hypothetical protein